MAEIGWAGLGILPTFDKFGPALERGSAKHLAAAGDSGGRHFGTSAGRSAGRRFGSVFSTAAKASLVGLAGAGAVAFKVGKDSIEQASDLGESLNAVNVTYEKQSKAVRKLGREAATSLGLSNAEFNSLAVRFAGFSKTISGGDGKKVVGTLDDLTTRAADFASVMNLDVNEAAGLFQSGLAGETEPLRRFGMDLSAAAVEAHAFEKGLAGADGELNEAEKVTARYSLLMKQTAKTQGDFANTSDSLANRQRILNARWDDARAKLGTGLLPIMEDAAGFLLDKGIPAFEDFSEWFTRKGIPAIGDFADDVRPLVKETLPAMGTALGDVRDMLAPAAKHAANLVEAFNDMPDWAKTAIVGGGASLLVGRKLGLGKLTGKAAGSLISSAKPIPVFVVNNGIDGGAGGGKKGWLKTLGKWGGPAAMAGFLAEPIITGDDATIKRGAESLAGAAGVGGSLGGIAEDAKRLDELLGGNKRKAVELNTELSRRIKLNVDNRPARDAIEEIRRMADNLRDTLNSLDVRAGGAAAAHRNKLAGDGYSGITVTGGMNFNGVDLPAARREAEHLRRTAALGGANFE